MEAKLIGDGEEDGRLAARMRRELTPIAPYHPMAAGMAGSDDRAKGVEQRLHRGTVVRAPRPEDAHGVTVHDDRIRAQLAGVLDRPAESPALEERTCVPLQGSGRVDVTQRCPRDPQPSVCEPVRIAQERPGPLEVPGEHRHGLCRAEAHRDRSRTQPLEVGAVLAHLDEVLLAGQSVPVADQHQQRRPSLSTEVDGPLRNGVEQHDAAEADRLADHPDGPATAASTATTSVTSLTPPLGS
jgi:hypothetical protein